MSKGAYRWLVAGYLVAVLLASMVTVWQVAAGWLVLLLLVSPERWRLLGKVVLVLGFFNGTISIGYALTAWWQGNPFLESLLLLNLRGAVITWMTLWLFSRKDWVRMVQALGMPVLTWLLVLTLSQIKELRRIRDEMLLAQKSRQLVPLPWSLRLRQFGAVSAVLLHRSLLQSKELMLVLKSRGFGL